MQVALCSAVCDVAPVIVLINFPETGKPVQNTNLSRCKTVKVSLVLLQMLYAATVVHCTRAMYLPQTHGSGLHSCFQ